MPTEDALAIPAPPVVRVKAEAVLPAARTPGIRSPHCRLQPGLYHYACVSAYRALGWDTMGLAQANRLVTMADPGLDTLLTVMPSSSATGTTTVRQSASRPVVLASPSTMRCARRPDSVSLPRSSVRREPPGSMAVWRAEADKSCRRHTASPPRNSPCRWTRQRRGA